MHGIRFGVGIVVGCRTVDVCENFLFCRLCAHSEHQATEDGQENNTFHKLDILVIYSCEISFRCCSIFSKNAARCEPSTKAWFT